MNTTETRLVELIQKAIQPVLDRLDNLEMVGKKVDDLGIKLKELDRKVEGIEESTQFSSDQFNELKNEVNLTTEKSEDNLRAELVLITHYFFGCFFL